MSTRLLIADDEPNLLISLEHLLRREAYEVHVVCDGLQALQALRQLKPALVVLDVMMPHKTGLEVCQELRADDSIKNTRVLMLSARARPADVAKGLGAGADVYMTKPFSTKELVQRIRELVTIPPLEAGA